MSDINVIFYVKSPHCQKLEKTCIVVDLVSGIVLAISEIPRMEVMPSSITIIKISHMSCARVLHIFVRF